MKQLYFFKFYLLLAFGVISVALFGQSVTYNFTGSVQTFTVPATGDYNLELWGAQGGDVTTHYPLTGGKGGYATGDVFLTAGQVINIYVGGKGADVLGNHPNPSCFYTAGGWNGGGANRSAGNGAPGGGASDVRIGGANLADRVIVAGAGGGCGWQSSKGGAGGGLVGLDGTQRNETGIGAKGGTQIAGGAAGSATGSCGKTAGSLGIGGDGSGYSAGGGGGGGGYYGGGGGGFYDGGGGGSSYIGGVTNASTLADSRLGHGQVIITSLCDNLTITGIPTSEVCTGSMITLTATSSNGGTISWDNGITNGVPFEVTSTTTYTATSTHPDDCVVPVTITILDDTTDPVIISTHRTLNVRADENCEAVLEDYTGDLIATDNCFVTVTQSPLAGTIISGLRNMVTLTATDKSGNFSEVSFTIKVDDESPAIVSEHPDVVVAANENCQALLPDFTGEVIATDNCDDDLFILQTHTPGKVIWGAVNAISITVVDDAGNSSFVRFNVAVEDQTDPTIACVENQNVDPDRIDTYTVFGEIFDPVSVDDNCGIAYVENDFNFSHTLDGAVFPLGTTTINWMVTDDSGNTANCSFDVTVNGTLGIENPEDNGISIYPNPASDKINFEFVTVQKRQLEIFDLKGRVVLSRTLESTFETIDLTAFEIGVYIVSLQEETKTITTRIVKQ